MRRDRIGIVGPGHMLRRLVKRGFEVAAFDAARTRPAREAGAAPSAAEVGRRSDTVGSEPEVYACLTGEEGALEGVNAGGCTPARSTASVDGVRPAPTGASAFPLRRSPTGGGRRNLACAGRRSRRCRGAVASGTFCSEHMGDVCREQVAKTIKNHLLVNGCVLRDASPSTSRSCARRSPRVPATTPRRATFARALKDMQMMEKLSDRENVSLAGLVLVKDGRAATGPPGWTGERGSE